jgi:hypothetical protein
MPLVTTKSSKKKGQQEKFSVKKLKEVCKLANVSGKVRSRNCALRTLGRYQKTRLVLMPIGMPAYQRWDFTDFDKFAKAHMV